MYFCFGCSPEMCILLNPMFESNEKIFFSSNDYMHKTTKYVPHISFFTNWKKKHKLRLQNGNIFVSNATKTMVSMENYSR